MILRLGHVEIGVDDLEAARDFYVGLLGFDEHLVRDGKLYLRAAEEFDAWSLVLTEGDGPGLGHVAFRTSSEEDLEGLERLHERLGLPNEKVPAGTEPGQGDALRVGTPDGHPVEFYHAFDEINLDDGDGVRLPMRRTNERRGIPPSRLDHVNIRVPNTDEALRYWRGELDFQPSEMWLHPDGSVRTCWVRRAPGTHDVAIGEGTEAGMHHVAYTVPGEMGLLRAADLLGDSGRERAMEYGPTRHGATNAFTMYVRDPAGNRLELYTGDYARDLDRPPIRWTAEEYERRGMSWWGLPVSEAFREANPLKARDWPTAQAASSTR